MQRVAEANRLIKRMSRQLKYAILNVNREVYASGFHTFVEDGIYYNGTTGEMVGEGIVSQATA